MGIDALIKALPPFERKRDVIVFGSQNLHEIIEEVLNAHTRYAYQYDCITGFFKGNILKKLFMFCQEYLPYLEESGSDQTTKSASALLQSYTNDCKHYAGFIGGTLDALNRTGRYHFNWYYRFVSYDKNRATADHVFIVCDDIWLDPTPIKIKNSKRYIQRHFNDRLTIPTYYVDIKANAMLSTLSGVHYTVDQEQPANSSSCLGCSHIGEVSPELQKAAEADESIAAVVQAADELSGWLPEGGLKDWLNGFLEDPTGAILETFFGKKYTTGDYKLGEVYMRNILGMMDIQRRGQVPDSYVPQAWSFFTLALGIPIGSLDHIDQLVISAENYKTWANGTFDWVPDDQVNRAVSIMNDFIGWTASYYPRDTAWQLSLFAGLPYIYPIWDIWPGGSATVKKYSGKHPITGLKILNGYPAATTNPQQPQTPIEAPIPELPTATLPVPGNPVPPEPPKGITMIEGLALAAAAGTLIYAVTRKKRKSNG
jgi:hypothetical protein